MENFDEHIENEYRRRFDNFEEIPEDILWKNIQTRIKPEKERPLVIWWNTMRGPAGIAASILIGLLIGAYFLTKPDNVLQVSEFTKKPDTSTSQPQRPDVSQKNNPAESRIESDKVASNARSNEPSQLVSTNAKSGRTANQAISPAPESGNQSLSVAVEENTEPIAHIPVEKKGVNQEENTRAVAANTPKTEPITDKPVIAETKQSEETDGTLVNNNVSEKVKEGAKTLLGDKSDETKLAINSMPDSVAIASEESVIKDTLFQSINALNGKTTYQLAVTEKKLTAPEIPATEIQTIESEEKHRLVFIPPTEIFANVTSTLSYYMFAPNKGDHILVENFSSSSQRLGFAAQLGFVYPIAKKMDLRTGLSYFSGKSRISYGVTDNSQKSVTVLNDNSIQINPGNATKNENRNWQYFELQSDVLYEVKKMQALSLGMKAGVQTSAINKPLLQARVGYRVSKAIAQHWALWLEPTVSVSLSSHHSFENLFMYRTTGLGLNMGVSLLR